MFLKLFFRFFTGFLTQVFPFAFLCIFPFRNYFRFSGKKTASMTAVLIFGLAFIFSLSGTLFALYTPDVNNLRGYSVVNGIFCICLLPCLFWYLYAIRTIWQKKIFIFFFALTCALTITSITGFFIADIQSSDPYNCLPYSTCTILLLLLTTAVLLPFLYLLLKHFFMPVEEELTAMEYGYITIFSVLVFFLLAGILSNINYHDLRRSTITLFLYFALFIVVFILYAIFFQMYLLAHNKYVTQQNYLQLQYQMDLQNEQYRHIQETIENNRRMRHDLKHHLLTLQGFLCNDEPEQAASYLQDYVRTFSDYELVKYSSNPIINLLLTHYAALAKEQDVAFEVRIHLPENLPVQDSDLSILLGNLLENAMTAACHAKKENRFIHLNLTCTGNSLVITADNGCDGRLCREQTHYLSTKPEHTGLGLSSMTRIAEKYHGSVSFSDEDVIFHSSILLELAEM